MPDGLSGHVQLGRHRQGRARREAAGRSHAPLHARRPVQQARRLRRVHAVPRAAPVPDAARRPERGRRLRADLLGRGARRDRRAPRPRHPRVRCGSHMALRGLGQHGAPPGLLRRGATALERRRRLSTPHDDLHDRGRGGNRLHARRQPHRHGSRDPPLLEAHHPLGQQHADHQPSPVARHHDRTSERRPPGGDRPDPDAHRRCRGQPPGARPRDRRRAGARAPARRAERGRGGSRLHRPPHARLGRVSPAHPGLPAGARRRDLRPPGRGDRGAGEANRPHASHGHPGDDGAPATRRRRDGGANHHLHPGRHRRLAISRRRRWLRHARLLRRELGGALSGRSAEDSRAH